MMKRMNEQEKKEIAEMTEAAKYLVLHDPQGFVIAKSNMDILKARADLEAGSRNCKVKSLEL